MRILTRYILGEITSHSLIGCALFTFILLMKPLEQILDMVVRNSSSFEVLLQVFLFTLPNLFLVSIPMLGKVPSLNVSVAAAVVLYEIVRQRRAAQKSTESK